MIPRAPNYQLPRFDDRGVDLSEEKTRQERREERQRKRRQRMRQHGKGLARIYRDAILKRKRRNH